MGAKKLLTLLGMISLALPAYSALPTSPPQRQSENGTDISLPDDGDGYSELVRRAHALDKTVDFRAMRFAYLESHSFQRANKRFKELETLRKELFAAVEAEDAQKIRDTAREILSIEYVNLDAHKLLRQSCEILGDDACVTRHRFVGLGLLRSIASTGDGRSCDTAWEVARVSEEYFVLRMIGVRLDRQSLVEKDGHICDRMEVVDESNQPRTYYFNVDKAWSEYGASK